MVVINDTDHSLDQVTLWYDNMPFEYQTVKSYSKETGIFEQHRLPAKIKVTWQSQTKENFSQSFNTFEFIPKNYANARVHLIYRNDNQFILEFDETEF